MQITNDQEGICKECVMTALGPVAEFLSTSRNITTYEICLCNTT